jgi:hypothetical protein
MPAARPRRIVRRAVMALVVVVLLTSGYVSSYLGSWWLAGRATIDQNQLFKLRETVFYPLELYCLQEWPGGHRLRVTAMWCLVRGSGKSVTFGEVDRAVSKVARPTRR